MATNDTTTAASEAALMAAFEERAHADGFLDDQGYFIGPDDLDVDPAGIEWPVAQSTS